MLCVVLDATRSNPLLHAVTDSNIAAAGRATLQTVREGKTTGANRQESTILKCLRAEWYAVPWWPSLSPAPITQRAAFSWTSRQFRLKMLRCLRSGALPGTLWLTDCHRRTIDLPLLPLCPVGLIWLTYIQILLYHNMMSNKVECA